MNFSFRFQTQAYVSQSFLQSLQYSSSKPRTNRLHFNYIPEILVLHDLWHLHFVDNTEFLFPHWAIYMSFSVLARALILPRENS